MAYPEVERRGQFLGLLDAYRAWKQRYVEFDRHSVAIGAMLPGSGTRMSPLTQRVFGIKPFLKILMRTGKDQTLVVGRYRVTICMALSGLSSQTDGLPGHRLEVG